MNLTPLSPGAFLVEARDSFLLTGLAASVAGLALSFFTQNKLALYAFALSGVTSSLGFWASRDLQTYKVVEKDLKDASEEVQTLQETSRLLKEEISQTNVAIASLREIQENLIEENKKTEEATAKLSTICERTEDRIEELKKVTKNLAPKSTKKRFPVIRFPHFS